MAVSLPSDIVMDVAKAVDPAGLAEARAELVRKAGLRASEGFAAAMGGTAQATGPAAAGASRSAGEAKSAETYKKFEATVLTTFIQSMLPKHTDSVYGQGLSGDMWKSMLAGKLADAMEARGGIGIAKTLLADRYKDGHATQSLGPVSRGPERSEIDTQTKLSSALLDEIQRNAMTTLGVATGTDKPSDGA